MSNIIAQAERMIESAGISVYDDIVEGIDILIGQRNDLLAACQAFVEAREKSEQLEAVRMAQQAIEAVTGERK